MTEREALGCDVVYLETALAEHLTMMNWLHHKVAPPTPKTTASLFRAFARDHNTQFGEANDG